MDSRGAEEGHKNTYDMISSSQRVEQAADSQYRCGELCCCAAPVGL